MRNASKFLDARQRRATSPEDDVSSFCSMLKYDLQKLNPTRRKRLMHNMSGLMLEALEMESNQPANCQLPTANPAHSYIPAQSFNTSAQSFNTPAQSYNIPAQSFNTPSQSYNPAQRSLNYSTSAQNYADQHLPSTSTYAELVPRVPAMRHSAMFVTPNQSP